MFPLQEAWPKPGQCCPRLRELCALPGRPISCSKNAFSLAPAFSSDSAMRLFILSSSKIVGTCVGGLLKAGVQQKDVVRQPEI